MDDDQQRRLDALHRLAQEQLGAQQAARQAPTQERNDDSDLVVEPLAPGEKKSTSASTRLSRGNRRGLVWTLIGAVALFAVILTGLFARSRFLPPPTPTPTPGPENALIVTSNFNSGTVAVNGKKVEGTFPLLVRLNPGDNMITYSAPPFHDRTCQVTLSAQADAQSGSRVGSVDEKCSPGVQEPPLSLNGATVKNGILYFQVTGDDLPTDLRNAAESALWAKLGTSRTFQVPAGDYYATGVDAASGHIRSARAAVALHASLALARPSVTQTGFCLNLSCPGFPILPDQGQGSPPSGTWLIQDAVVVGWRFATQGGALVAAPPPQFAGTMVEAGLMYSATAGWSVGDSASWSSITDLQAQLFSGSCNNGFIALQTLIGQSSLASVEQNLSYGQSAAPSSTDGCAISVEGQNSNPLGITGSTKKYGHYIWRWGVLLAADAQAREVFPFLPIAPQSEIAAVGGFA